MSNAAPDSVSGQYGPVPIPEREGKKWPARYGAMGVVGSEGPEELIPFQTRLVVIHSR